jgi:hypothetical protein
VELVNEDNFYLRLEHCQEYASCLSSGILKLLRVDMRWLRVEFLVGVVELGMERSADG